MRCSTKVNEHSVKDYLGPTFFGPPKRLSRLTSGERSAAVVTPLQVPLHTSAMSSEPLWSLEIKGYTIEELSFDGKTSIWLSDSTDRLLNKQSRQAYVELCEAVYDNVHPRSVYYFNKPSSLLNKECVDQLSLAKAMHADNITVGMVFDSDPSMAVWPRGRH